MADETQEIVTAGEPISELEAPIEAVPVDLPVDSLPVEESWPLWDGYLIGLDWILPIVMIIASYIVLRHLIWNSLRFNYLHYLEHGEFVIFWGDDGNNYEKKEHRDKIAKKMNVEADFVSWCASLLMSLVVLGIHAVIAILWPITIILVFPLALVRLVGYRKRRKIEFTQKLKGEHLNKEQQV